MPKVCGSETKAGEGRLGRAMSSAWGLLFAAKCRHHVFLRTLDEPITNTAVAIVLWTSAWQQFVQLADPVTRLDLPSLGEFFHLMAVEAGTAAGCHRRGTGRSPSSRYHSE